jgi:hypothetical protein
VLVAEKLKGPRVKEMISIVWEVCALDDESELGKHFPGLAKLVERSSDLLDGVFSDFTLEDPPDPDVVVGFSDETNEALERLRQDSRNLADSLLKEFGH